MTPADASPGTRSTSSSSASRTRPAPRASGQTQPFALHLHAFPRPGSAQLRRARTRASAHRARATPIRDRTSRRSAARRRSWTRRGDVKVNAFQASGAGYYVVIHGADHRHRLRLHAPSAAELGAGRDRRLRRPADRPGRRHGRRRGLPSPLRALDRAGLVLGRRAVRPAARAPLLGLLLLASASWREVRRCGAGRRSRRSQETIDFAFHDDPTWSWALVPTRSSGRPSSTVWWGLLDSTARCVCRAIPRCASSRRPSRAATADLAATRRARAHAGGRGAGIGDPARLGSVDGDASVMDAVLERFEACRATRSARTTDLSLASASTDDHRWHGGSEWSLARREPAPGLDAEGVANLSRVRALRPTNHRYEALGVPADR